MQNTEPNLSIRYAWRDGVGVDLDVLGDSLKGFNDVIEHILRIPNIQGDISIKAHKVDQGSIIFELYIQFINHLAFISPKDYLDFLSVAGVKVPIEILTGVHMSLNELFAKYPFDAFLTGLFITKMIERSGQQKRLTPDPSLPSHFTIDLHRIISRKTYRKALRPFIEDEVSEIEIWPKRDKSKKTLISVDNFENYLSEDAQILPQYENGKLYKFKGKIVGLESSRGEYLKFKAEGLEREYSLLIAFLEDDKATEDYIRFYKKRVVINAEILRKSMYQKPKLIIKSLEILDQELFKENHLDSLL